MGSDLAFLTNWTLRMMTPASIKTCCLLNAVCFLLGCSFSASADSGQEPAAITVNGGRYFGSLVDGKLHGHGRIEWDNGDSYEGDFLHGQYSGKGKRVWTAGDVYEGEFRDGRMSGHGRSATRDGSIYVGRFRDDRFNGNGRYELASGAIYEGEFKDGQFHGQGNHQTKRGVYLGEFQHGQFHGNGRFDNGAGEVYEGEFKLGEFTGTGTYTHTSAGRYEGEFRNWIMQGAGRYSDPAGNIYEGHFEEGQLQGEGSYTGVDGMHYQGGFSQWRFSGHGGLHQVNGDEYVGQFANGFYEGHGTLTYATPQEDGRTQDSGVWNFGTLEGQREVELGSKNVETALYNQRRLLDEAINSLKPGDPETIDMYMLAVGGDGSQEVFRREVEFVSDQFSQRFGTNGRTVTLVNSRTTVDTLPMATLTSIEESLQAISQKMNRDQDILFLYLTSHGSKDHQFALGQESMSLRGLQASRLGEMLRESNIRWKVVVVSACYGGGFIEPVKGARTLVITAARHDRRSFGCADENDFTYFGRAFFKDALPDSDSFQEAFAKAEKLVRERELADQKSGGEVDTEDFSLPQMVNSDSIAQYLHRWWAYRAVRSAR
jgi:hypothetical protein